MSFDNDNMALCKRYTARVISPKGKATTQEETKAAKTGIELITIKNKNCAYSNYTSNTAHPQLTNTVVARGLDIGISDDITNRIESGANIRVYAGYNTGTCRSGTSIDAFRSNTDAVTVGITGDTPLRGARATHARGDGARDTGGSHTQDADGSYTSATPPTASLGSIGETGADAACVMHTRSPRYRANNAKVADGTTCDTSIRGPRAPNEWGNVANRMGGPSRVQGADGISIS